MKAYKVESTNIDIQDGIFDHGYFMELRHALDVIKAYASSHNGNNVVEDIEGKLETYNDNSLNYSPYHNKPAVYYQSHWGNYNMVIWIKEIHIQE